MRGPIEFSIVKSLLVALNDAFDPANPWVENVAIEGETVRSPIDIGRDCASKTIQVDHLVRVVELENVTNTLDGLQVLVLLWVEKVKGVRLTRVAVREREIDG